MSGDGDLAALEALGTRRLAEKVVSRSGEAAKYRRLLQLERARSARLTNLLLLDKAGRLDLDKIDRLLRDCDTPPGRGDVSGTN